MKEKKTKREDEREVYEKEYLARLEKKQDDKPKKAKPENDKKQKKAKPKNDKPENDKKPKKAKPKKAKPKNDKPENDKKQKKAIKNKKTQSSNKLTTKSKKKSRKGSVSSIEEEDTGIVLIDDNLTVDKEKELEERRAYLEEARSQDGD